MTDYRCPECGYVYSEERGDAREGFPAGTPFSALPDEFACPDCSVRYKEDFETV
jgi:rubredoxin